MTAFDLRLDPHEDFSTTDTKHHAAWLMRECKARPFTTGDAGDALLFAAGAEPSRMTRAGLVVWLRENDLARLARLAERLRVPGGSVIALIVGDAGARVGALDVQGLGGVPALDDEQLDALDDGAAAFVRFCGHGRPRSTGALFTVGRENFGRAGFAELLAVLMGGAS